MKTLKLIRLNIGIIVATTVATGMVIVMLYTGIPS